MRTIEVCLTPELIHQYSLKNKLVVAVDIFRATSCIVTGLSNGVKAIKPVAEVDEAKALGMEGYLMAGERGGKKIEGFDLGNSPFDYLEDSVKGNKVVISTTNGSKTILASKEADEVIIGSFLNIGTVAEYVLQTKKDLVIHCAGWKGTVNLEDTLFAGALIDECAEEMKTFGDSALIAHHLYMNNHENPYGVARKSSHAERLAGFGIEKDLEFCMTENKYDVLPRMVGDEINLL